MTRDEYVKWLKQLDENLKFDGLIDGDKVVDLHEMIFDLCEMLEQQTCEDAVSREDALMALTGEWTESTDELIHRFFRRIRNLPSVNPHPKTGHWIYDRTRDWDGECKYECSECGMGSDVDYPYCMRCGAKMVEPQESEG